MKIHAKNARLGLALAFAVPILLAGCDKSEEQASAPPAVAVAPSASTVTAPVGTTVGNEIDDSVVTAKVKAALLADPEAKSFEIKVETRKGQVQLSGFVDSRAHMDNAIALARTVEGVQGVEDAMSLKGGKASIGLHAANFPAAADDATGGKVQPRGGPRDLDLLPAREQERQGAGGLARGARQHHRAGARQPAVVQEVID